MAERTFFLSRSREKARSTYESIVPTGMYVALDERYLQLATSIMAQTSEIWTAADNLTECLYVFQKRGGEVATQFEKPSAANQLLVSGRDAYLAAFEKVLSSKPKASLFPVNIDGETIWRLTFVISPQTLNDAEKLVAAESEIHEYVYQVAPQLVGMFSLQYVADDAAA
ncbi:MAG TPA: hypothetical protein VGH02_03260 [Rhizomicrobium sp.]|jgi:hypothetical protein